MITIKINEIEMTIEEVRELYKQLSDLLFEPKTENPARFDVSFGISKPAGFLDPRLLSTTAAAK